MDHSSQPNSQLASVTFARELVFLNRASSMLDIMSQLQDTEILISCQKSVLWKIRSYTEIPYAQVSFWSILPFKGYHQKEVPAKLKPIVGGANNSTTKSQIWGIEMQKARWWKGKMWKSQEALKSNAKSQKSIESKWKKLNTKRLNEVKNAKCQKMWIVIWMETTGKVNKRTKIHP